MAARSAIDIRLLDRLVAAMPAASFAAQRWFRAKGRPIESLALDDAAPLVADLDRAELDAIIAIVRVSYADGGDVDRYLLPLVFDPDLAEPSSSDGLAIRDQASGVVLREPRDGDGFWRRLAVAIATGTATTSLHGRLVCEPTPALAELVPSPAEALLTFDERRMHVEQTNSSVVLGERLIYKSYRRLEPGVNPDLEVSAFLTQHTSFTRTPALAGSVRHVAAGGEETAIGMLQAFLATSGDAWSWLLDRMMEPAGREAVARIGDLTAHMHAALASHPEVDGFVARPATADDLRAWKASAEGQLEGALSSVSGEERRRLNDFAPRIRERFAAFGRASDARVSRIHGDYHLGQLLRTGDDFAVIDFEGEPARPLAERRELASPLKDVAGMLRSFDYAAQTAAQRDPNFAADAWLHRARDAFLGAYRSAGDDIGLGDELLAAFELEKACYEVRYEANNRPAWIWLPLDALRRLVQQ